jgi:hypothetical protein
VSQYRDAHRDPALEAEHRCDRSPRDAGHLVMPDGSLVSSGDGAFIVAAAPHVYAAHLRAMAEAKAAA